MKLKKEVLSLPNLDGDQHINSHQVSLTGGDDMQILLLWFADKIEFERGGEKGENGDDEEQGQHR